MINLEYMLDKLFQEILHRIDKWINQESSCVIEFVDAENVNISFYNPLSSNTYIEYPNKIKNPMQGLINVKSNDNKCFLWCHIRYSDT